MSTVFFLLADGFEELEFVAPYDILHRGGIEIKTVSISDKNEVTGAHGLTVLANSLLSQIEDLPFDMLVLPGGAEGTENLIKSDVVRELLLKTYIANKQIAAICAAPKVLVNAGLIGSHAATSYPSVREEVEPACRRYLDAPLVISENIITSRGAGTAAEFGFGLLALLSGYEMASIIKSKMMF